MWLFQRISQHIVCSLGFFLESIWRDFQFLFNILDGFVHFRELKFEILVKALNHHELIVNIFLEFLNAIILVLGGRLKLKVLWEFNFSETYRIFGVWVGKTSKFQAKIGIPVKLIEVSKFLVVVLSYLCLVALEDRIFCDFFQILILSVWLLIGIIHFVYSLNLFNQTIEFDMLYLFKLYSKLLMSFDELLVFSMKALSLSTLLHFTTIEVLRL